MSYLDIIKQAMQANADRKQALKNFEKTVNDNIIAELCTMKKSVMANYKKILEDIQNNDKIKDKENTQKNITESFKKLVDIIDETEKERR